MDMNDLSQKEVREKIALDFTKDGLFELAEHPIRGNKYHVFANAPKNLFEYFQFGLTHGEWNFISYEGKQYSYQETLNQAAGLSHLLINEYGIKKGDRVAFAMRNYPEWIFSYIAITSLGAIAVPLNSWWLAKELEYAVTHSDARIFIGDEERITSLDGLILDIPRISVRSKRQDFKNTVYFEEVVKPMDHFPQVEVSPEDDASIMYTSGSTGFPKGVVSTHRSIISTPISWLMLGYIASSVDSGAGQQIPEHPCTIAAVPLFHVTGSHSIFLLSVLLKRNIVLMYKWDPLEAIKLIEKYKVTTFSGVPTMAWEILQAHKQNPDIDLSSLLDLGAGGAARPPEQLKAQEKEFPDKGAQIGYGLTETNAAGTNAGGALLYERPTSAGFPTPFLTSVRILDEKNKDLKTGEIGEVAIKSTSNFRCYWKDEEATDEVLDKEGWFKTGDVGTLDENGFLYIKDRIKDIVIRGGENIACLEIEATIYEHPSVLEASVFGVPDDRLGEKLAVRIATNPKMELNEEDISSFLEKRLAKFKIPEFIWIQDQQLPRIASGKIAKKEMREEAIKELEMVKEV